MTTNLLTPHLRLTPFTEAHRADMVRFYGNPEVMAIRKYGVRDPEAAAAAFEVLLAHWRDHGFGLHAAHDRRDDAFMGECGLRHTDDGAAVEVSYGLLPAFRGRGLATEGALAVMRQGFTDLGLARIVAFSRGDNRASHKVLEKIGMHFDGRDDRGAHGVVRYVAEAETWPFLTAVPS